MHPDARSLSPRAEWPFVRRTVLTIACIQLAGLLAVGAVVWHTGGKLEPGTTLAAQVNAADLNVASPAARSLGYLKSVSGTGSKY